MAKSVNWQAVVDATVASERADCGHLVKSTTVVWLRTERAGGALEVWSVCLACRDTQTDYEFSTINPDRKPRRVRFEYLD